jgi:hypothetical protein
VFEQPDHGLRDSARETASNEGRDNGLLEKLADGAGRRRCHELANGAGVLLITNVDALL